MDKFFTRHRLALRACTSISQKLPKISECVLIKFYADAARFMKIGKYSFTLVGNMDQTPAFFDMVSSKCIVNKGVRECVSIQEVKRNI